jgi:hypothetical protein
MPVSERMLKPIITQGGLCYMKKLLLAALICVFGGIFSLPVFAELPPDRESEFFCVQVPVEKVYTYRKGYVVTYRKGIHGFAHAYLPIEWFNTTAGKGDIVKLQAPRAWPYLAVYYKEGEFSHVRLYVHRVNSHETWGAIPLNVNIDDRFENIDTLKLEF